MENEIQESKKFYNGINENIFESISDYLEKGSRPKNDRFIIGRTPLVLQITESDFTEVTIPTSVIKKAVEIHNLSKKEIFDSICKLYNPVLIFDSDKNATENKNESKLILTDVFKDQKPIALAVNINTDIKLKDSNISVEVQDIRSIHDRAVISKNGTDLIKKWSENGLCRYVDDKKIANWSSLARVQFPIEPHQLTENNILTKTELVNKTTSALVIDSNHAAVAEFPYKLPWEMKEIESQTLQTENKIPLEVVARSDFNYFNSDKISFTEYIVRTDASVAQDLIEKNHDSFYNTNTELEESAIPCIIVRKSKNPEIQDQFLLSKYANNNLNKDEIAEQAGKFASKEIKIEDTELIAQIENVIERNDKKNKTRLDIPELKLYHTLKEDDVRNLEVISDQEFAGIVDSIILNDYKNIPNAIRLPNLNEQLSEKLGLEKDSAFILKKNATHIRPDRKGGYNQALSTEEYYSIPKVIRQADFVVVDKRTKNFQIVFDDNDDIKKINKLVFNKDELGNYLVTVGKVDRRDSISEENNTVVAVGVAPTISALRYSEELPATRLRPSTATVNETIPQVTQKSINEQKAMEKEYQEYLGTISPDEESSRRINLGKFFGKLENQQAKEELNVSTYKFQSGRTLEEIIQGNSDFPTEAALLDNLIDGNIREVYEYATDEEKTVLRQFASFRNDYDTDIKNLAVQTDCVSRWIATKHWNPEMQEFQQDYVNHAAVAEFPYKLPWEMKEIESQTLQTENKIPLEVVARSDFNYFNSDKISFTEYIVRTDASVAQDLIEKNHDSFYNTNTELEESAIPCIIVRKSKNPEIQDQFLLSKYANNNLNKDEIAEQAGNFASKEIKIEDTELITQIENVIERNEKQNKTQLDIPELKIHSELKEEKIKNLEVIKQEEFDRIVEALYQDGKPDYKSIPEIIRLPKLNDELAGKLNIENENFFLKTNIAHSRPQRKGGYDQNLRKEEMKGMLDFISSCQTAYIDTDEQHQNFFLAGLDEKDNTKANKIVFNKDELGNYIVTIGKVDTVNLQEKNYAKVAVGVEPTIWSVHEERSPATMLRPSTTLATEETIPQVTQKSINEQKTRLQILEQEDNEHLVAMAMESRKVIKEVLDQNAVPLVEIDFSKVNYDRLFPRAIVQTPLETVKLGENQFEKLDAKDRKRFLLATFQTLATPDLVIDEERNGNHSHNYIKSFVFDEKTKAVQDVVVNISGENISITAHPRDINNVVNKIKMPDQLVYAAARVGQVIEQRTQEAQSIVNPTRVDRLSTISVPLNKEYSIENALSIISEFQSIKGQKVEPEFIKKFEKLKNLSKTRAESEENASPEKENSEGNDNTRHAIKSKSDIIRQAGKDFLKSVVDGTAPFFNAKDDFQRIIMRPQAIINASNGLPFSGESQLLAQIYHTQKEMKGEIVTSIAGAKEAGTIILNTPENRSDKNNFVLTDTTPLAQKNAVIRTRYFMPESCEEPEKIYAHTLQQQRPEKIRSYRDLIRHFENIPNGQKEIADIRIRIAHEHLKEIQSRFAVNEERTLSVDEIEERKNFLRNYFERLPSDYRDTERGAFEDTFGIQLNPEKTLEINLEREFKDIDFDELKKNTKKSIELENRKLSDFIEKNTMANKKVATLFCNEYKTLAKEEKLTARNLKIEALGIKEPETFLGKYLAACNTNAEFITDKETMDEVKKNLVKKLEENFKIEKYDILKEIGQQAQSISNETTKQISFEKAHSNKKNLDKNISPEKEISLIGMGK